MQKAAPSSDVAKLIRAKSVCAIPKSAINGSVMSPRPWERPGSVAVIAKAATATMIQP